MKNIIVTEYVSLDGVMENPAWTVPYWKDDTAKFKFDELFASEVLLLGRVTYQGFAASWPSQKDEQGFADRMNNLPKFVVSTTLEKVEWNNSRLINKNITKEISILKQQPGQDILVYGSADLVHTLRRNDLVDEYRLLVYLLVLGSGKRLFRDEGNTANLEFIEAISFSSGVIALIYRPIRKEKVTDPIA